MVLLYALHMAWQRFFSLTRGFSMSSMYPSESTFNLLEEDEEADDQSEEGICKF